MAYLALGVLFLLLALLGARLFVNAQPAVLARVLKWSAVGVAGVVGGYLAVTGRLGWALFAAPALVPMFNRLRRAFQTGGATFGGGYGHGDTGQSSEVRTAFVRMELDHDSGEMSGEVLAGRFRGRTLASMSLPDLLALLDEAETDPQSVQLLSAYLDRHHGEDWRECAGAGTGRGDTATQSGTMSRAEAYEILGLEPGADAAAIKAAYHRLMSKMHPDRGGSTYLAAKINQAKDLLLDA